MVTKLSIISHSEYKSYLTYLVTVLCVDADIESAGFFFPMVLELSILEGSVCCQIDGLTTLFDTS